MSDKRVNDNVFTPGDSGSPVWAVQVSATGALSAEGKYAPLQVDSSGNLRVVNASTGVAAGDGSILDGSNSSIKATVLDLTNSNPLTVAITDTNGDQISSFGGGTQYTEDAAAAANPVGTVLNLIRTDTPAGRTTTDGDNVAACGTDKGELYVKHTDSIAVTNAGLTELAAAIDTEVQCDIVGALPAGTNNIGDVDVVSSALPTGASTLAEQQSQTTHLSTIAGDTTSIQTAVELIDDTIATDGAATPTKGILIAGQDGTNAQTIKTDTDGNLQVDVLTMPSTTVTATDLDIRDLTATDVVTANLSATDNAVLDSIDTSTQGILADTANIETSVQLIDDTVATLGTTTYTEAATKGLIIGAVRRDADTTLVDTTNEVGPVQMNAAGQLKVEVFSGETLPVSLTSTTVTGTVAVTQSGTWDEVGINDSGNSITVDNAQLSVVGSGTEAAAMRVTIATDSTGVLSVDDNGGALTVDNAGTFATQSTLQTGDNTVGRVKLTDGTDVADVLDLTNSNPLTVAIVDGSGDQITSFGGGTQYTEDAAAAANPVGTVLNLIRSDTPAGRTTTDGDNVAACGTDKGELYVKHIDAIPVTDNGGALTVDGTVTVTATNLDVRDLSSASDSVAVHGDVGVIDQLDLTNSNPAVVAIVDGNGDQITSFGGGTQYTEDAAAAANPVGTVPILVRTDTPATQTTTDGDNVAQRGTNYGAAYVQVVTSAGAYVDTFGGGTQYTEGDTDATITGTAMMMEGAGNALVAAPGTAADGLLVNLGTNNDVTVTGSVTANAGTNLNTSALALETGGNLDTISGDTTSIDSKITACNTGAVVISSGTVTTVSTVTNLAQMAGAAISMGTGVRDAGTQRVTIATDDSVPVTGTFWQATQPVSAASLPLPSGASTEAKQPALGTAGSASTDVITVQGIASMTALVVDGSGVTQPVSGTVTANLSATDNAVLDTIELNTDSLAVVGGGTEATAVRVTIANNSTGVVSVDDNGGALTVDGTVTANLSATDNAVLDQIELNQDSQTSILTTMDADTGGILTAVQIMDDWDNAASNGASVSGDVAHDTADAGEPVKIGSKAVSTLATATMVAANDRANAVSDLDGTILVRGQFPLSDLLSERISNTNGTSTAFTNFAATASTYNNVVSITVYNSSATAGYVDFRDGTAGSILYTLPLPAGGGATVNAGGLVLFRTSANTALAYDVSAALSTVYISLSGFKSKT